MKKSAVIGCVLVFFCNPVFGTSFGLERIYFDNLAQINLGNTYSNLLSQSFCAELDISFSTLVSDLSILSNKSNTSEFIGALDIKMEENNGSHDLVFSYLDGNATIDARFPDLEIDLVYIFDVEVTVSDFVRIDLFHDNQLIDFGVFLEAPGIQPESNDLILSDNEEILTRLHFFMKRLEIYSCPL